MEYRSSRPPEKLREVSSRPASILSLPNPAPNLKLQMPLQMVGNYGTTIFHFTPEISYSNFPFASVSCYESFSDNAPEATIMQQNYYTRRLSRAICHAVGNWRRWQHCFSPHLPRLVIMPPPFSGGFCLCLSIVSRRLINSNARFFCSIRVF